MHTGPRFGVLATWPTVCPARTSTPMDRAVDVAPTDSGRTRDLRDRVAAGHAIGLEVGHPGDQVGLRRGRLQARIGAGDDQCHLAEHTLLSPRRELLEGPPAYLFMRL